MEWIREAKIFAVCQYELMDQFEGSKETSPEYHLRQATETDVELMFRLQHLDGKGTDTSDADQVLKFEKYRNDFNPSEIQVVEHEGQSIGRLRVVRGDTIYIGGIQILPEWRGEGIGTQIIEHLIHEADEKLVPITLEVRHNNTEAYNLYERLGFQVVEEDEIQKMMRYEP